MMLRHLQREDLSVCLSVSICVCVCVILCVCVCVRAHLQPRADPSGRSASLRGFGRCGSEGIGL